MPKIVGTSNYKSFKRLMANRQVNHEHLLNLINSIRMRNLLEYAPIVVNKQMEVIDGQHRLMAAEKLGVPVYYVVAPQLTISDVQLLNSNLRGWTMYDYLESYIAQGNKHYVILKRFMEKYKVSLSTAAAMLSIKESNQRLSSPYRRIKRGEFEIENLEMAEEFAQFYQEVAKFCEENTHRDRDFIRATYLVYRSEEVDTEDFLAKLQSFDKPLYRRAGVREYMMQFEDVFNRGRGPKVRLY